MLFVVCRSLLDVRSSLFIVRRLLFHGCCLMFVVVRRFSFLIVVRCLMFVV